MNIFFIVDNLSNSELSYDLIYNINESKNESYSIFFQNHMPPIIQPECLTMNINGLSSATGIAVAFDLASAMIIKNTNCNSEKVLYLYNMEWLYNALDYILVREILDNFKIFVRSESHANIVKNFIGNNQVYIAESMKEFFTCLS